MEKRRVIFGVFVFGVLSLVLPLSGEAVTTNVDCSLPQSLQTAISNGAAGDTFMVSGTCNENITISESRERVIIDGSLGGGTATINGGATSPTVQVRGQGVTVRNFNISGGNNGIYVFRGGAAIIHNNTISSGGAGISVVLDSNATIINNTITSNLAEGITVSEGSAARIGFASGGDTTTSPNTISSNTGPGISVFNGSTARIVGNVIQGNGSHGISVFRESQANIAHNLINSNVQSGILVGSNSTVALGGTAGGTTIFDPPNDTTVNNGNRGLECNSGATVFGNLGTLNGVNGAIGNGGIGIKSSGLSGDYGLDLLTASSGLIRLGNETANNTTKIARMVVRHFTNAEEPVYLFGAASTSTNNFVAFGGGSTLGNAATQLDFFTAPTPTTTVGTARITIKGDGTIGMGTPTPVHPLQMASGAHVTAGGAWTDASSREYKDNIETLSTEEAFGTLRELNPVKFAYKADRSEKHVGFIAEEVPDLIATKDRKGLSPMDIVAVLTKVVQEQQESLKELKAKNERLEQRLLELEGKGKAGE